MEDMRIYGWRPDTPDHRDFLFKVSAPTALPGHIDLRLGCPPVYDQSRLGSCTANSIAGLIHFLELKQKMPKIFTPSRLFIYYNERAMEGTINSDAGAMIRDGIKTVVNQGVCDEVIWPYDISKFKIKPSLQCYLSARRARASQYSRIQSLNDMKTCLAEGFPFVFGFTVYESFESQQMAKTGNMPMPSRGERALGGHAVMACGYDDPTQKMLVRNSWGNRWGMAGYFTMPYQYITNSNLASDMWTIRQV